VWTVVEVPTKAEYDAKIAELEQKLAGLENRLVYIETLIEQGKIALQALTEMLYPAEA